MATQLRRFPLTGPFEADCKVEAEFLHGEIFHVNANRLGSGSVSTPVARYFVTRPTHVEEVRPHWRLDCYVRRHRLAGNPEAMTRALAQSLVAQGHCPEPMWLGWHRSTELGGDTRGDLWDLD